MADDEDDIERLTSEALTAIQRLSVIVPLAIHKARLAGARETAARIARLAVQFPEETEPAENRSQAVTAEPRAKRIGRGKIPAYITQRLEEAGSGGLPRTHTAS
jgi:hypothetical protein